MSNIFLDPSCKKVVDRIYCIQITGIIEVYIMRFFHNDYNEMCHPAVLQELTALSGTQNIGYGVDDHCKEAADMIRKLCGNDKLAVHFLVGGTQTNLTVIAASLRPHQAVIAADSGHISIHETGAIEATGHKVLELPSADGKLKPEQITKVACSQSDTMDAEHTVQPKMVYISHPTELGTTYTKAELTAISEACKAYNLRLFVDGARMGYGLAAADSDLTLADFAELTDVFYIGGTKVGAMFGEAVVISNPEIAQDFRYLIKQRGGMLAKGRLLGIQFETLFEDGLYWEISDHALKMAEILRTALAEAGLPMQVQSPTNQLFPIVPDTLLEKLREKYAVTYMNRVDEHSSCIRLCTSWATREEDVRAFCDDLKEMM